jgi:hypothetical protein
MWEGGGAGAMVSGLLVNGSRQTAVSFQFPFIVLDGRLTLLSLRPLSPTSTIITFNFNPLCLSI